MRNCEKRRRGGAGFTLAELLVVVAIIGVLVAISIPVFSGQLEKARRAVDMANARNIQSVLSAGLNSGDIAFTSSKGSGNANTYDACVAIIVSPEGTSGFLSGNITVHGKSYDNSDGASTHERIIAYIEKYGLANYKTRCHDTADGGDGWNWYGVFLYSDGTMRIASGTNKDYTDYKNVENFEFYTNYWKTAAPSNIEKAMGR